MHIKFRQVIINQNVKILTLDINFRKQRAEGREKLNCWKFTCCCTECFLLFSRFTVFAPTEILQHIFKFAFTFFITQLVSRQNIFSQTPPKHSIFSYASKILSHLTFDKLCHTCCASVTLHWKHSNKPVRFFFRLRLLKICANSEVN